MWGFAYFEGSASRVPNGREDVGGLFFVAGFASEWGLDMRLAALARASTAVIKAVMMGLGVGVVNHWGNVVERAAIEFPEVRVGVEVAPPGDRSIP